MYLYLGLSHYNGEKIKLEYTKRIVLGMNALLKTATIFLTYFIYNLSVSKNLI